MLAVLVEDPRITQLVTGDKRALRQIANMTETDAKLNQRLQEARIDCLESVMLGLMDLFGHAAINAKACLGVDSDKVLKMTFGLDRNEAHARAVLEAYLKDLTDEASFVEH